MVKIQKLIFALLIMTMGTVMTSCLDDSDDNQIRTYMSVSTVTGYSTTSAYFVEVSPYDGKEINLFCDNGKINQTKFPVGSRAFITYQANPAQDLDLPVKISLMSIREVKTLPVTVANREDCVLDYDPFNITTCYYAGGYINIVLTLNRDEKRQWKCLLDKQSSTGNVAELYLISESDSKDYIGTTEALSIDVNELSNTYSTFKLHVNSQQGNNYVINLDTK